MTATKWRPPEWVFITFVVLFLLWLVARTIRQDAEHAAQVRVLTLRADSLARATLDSQAVYRERQTADSVDMAGQARTIARLSDQYRYARGRTDTLLDSLVDSAQVVAIRSQLDQERAAAQELLARQDSTIQWQASRVVYWRDTALVASQQTVAAQQALLRQALALKRPRTACGPSVAVGYGTGGIGTTIGYGCTIRFP